ncbi:MAG: helix-turn-helix transcriptional regulator [Candidatus Sericytochromatia bacterium]
MTIIINIDVMMAKRKIKLNELASLLDITEANASNLKNGKIKAFKISTLNEICKVLECQPSDILEYKDD